MIQHSHIKYIRTLSLSSCLLLITGKSAALEGFDAKNMNNYEERVLAAYSYAASSKACGHKDNYEQLKYLYEALISYGKIHDMETKTTKAVGSINTDILIEMGVREYSRTSKISCQDVQKFSDALIPVLAKFILE